MKEQEIREKIIILLDFCYHNRITVVFGATSRNINGTYNRFTRTIELDWSLTWEEKYKTFLHEIGHWSIWYLKNKSHTEKEATREGYRIAELLGVDITNTKEA